jgi:hypothetical protein
MKMLEYFECIFFQNYYNSQGELPLIWNGVQITGIEFQSIADSSVSANKNQLETSFGEVTVKAYINVDASEYIQNGTLDYCIKRLEHTPFVYTITIVRMHRYGSKIDNNRETVGQLCSVVSSGEGCIPQLT